MTREIQTQAEQFPDRVAAPIPTWPCADCGQPKSQHDLVSHPKYHYVRGGCPATGCERYRGTEEAYSKQAYTGDGQTEAELATSHPHQHHDGISIMRDTGLYGEDEDHPVDFIGKPNPKGDGFDVIRHLS